MNRIEQYWDILEGTHQLLQGKDRRKEVLETGDLVIETAAPEEETLDSLDLDQIAERIMDCTLCGLCSGRKHPVPGTGVMNPKVMVIGEAPGAQEDESGLPFVGKSGNYLDRWMNAIDLDRQHDLFIGNIIKCRPPDNRDPFPEEQAACIPYLNRQLELIKPETILCVGRISTQILLDTTDGLGKLRGTVYSYRGIPLVATYHPSAVLRYPDKYRRPVWEDLKLLRSVFDPASGE